MSLLTFEQIQEIIAAVAEHGVESVEIERSGFRLSVVGRSAPTVVAAVPQGHPDLAAAAPVSVQPAAPQIPVAPESSTGANESRAEAAEPVAEGHVVTSPIVGTFYSAPNPESEPYVRVGDRVKVGQVLCIVEAMKLMNEIESDIDGVVVEIFPQNAQPVEFGERLFAISTD